MYLASALLDQSLPIWLDRFGIHPSANWQEGIADSRNQASYGIVVVCESYLASPYCLDEYRALKELDIPIIGVIVDDVAIDDWKSTIEVSDWIDFRNRQDDEQFSQKCAQVAELLPRVDDPVDERTTYLYNIIIELETRLAQMPTTRAIYNESLNLVVKQPSVRPRGYDVNLLREWHLMDQSMLEIEDVLSWLSTQRQFILSGKAGTGKTAVASMLMMLAVHDALGDVDAPLPMWFDLALWQSDQSLDDYLSSQWMLGSSWQAWLGENPGWLVFDNLADLMHLNPDKLGELTAWLDTLTAHKLMVVARDVPDDWQTTLQTVQIEPMPNINVQRFGRTFLVDDQISAFKRLVSQNKDRLEQRYMDFVACGIELASADDRQIVENWFKSPIESLILKRWRAQFADGESSIALEDFVQALRKLAWQMMQQSYAFMLRRDAVAEVVAQELVTMAIDLGILRVVGDYVRFDAQLYVAYLSMQNLLDDGLYVHIKHPQFDADGQRVATRWDDTVCALIETSDGKQQAHIIRQIIEIDPYLAHHCLQASADLYAEYFDVLIGSMIELRSIDADSHTALTQTIRQMPDMFTVALTMLKQLNLYSWRIQHWLWSEFLKLPLDTPSSLIQIVGNLDRESQDAIGDLQDEYETSELTVYLAQLTVHQDDAVCHNAIWLVGQLNHDLSLIGLLNLLNHPLIEIRQEALDAIIHLKADDLPIKLINWIEQYPNHTGVMGTVIYQQGRYVSGSLLIEWHGQNVAISAEYLAMLRTMSDADLATEIIAYMVSMYPDVQQNLDFAQAHDVDEINIPKLLQTSLGQLPRESLDRLLESARRTLKLTELVDDTPELTEPVADTPEPVEQEADMSDLVEMAVPDPVEPSTSAMGSVVQRIQSAVESSRVVPTGDVVELTGSLVDVEQKLQDDDWLVRLRAIESLSALPAEQSLPLVLRLTDDQDIQVRVAALGLLGNFAGHDDAIQKLVATLTDDDAVVVDVVTDLLKTKDIVDAATLVGLLKTNNVQQVAAVLDILSVKAEADALPYLVPFLTDNRKAWMDKTLADYAMDAVRAIGTPEALALLKPLIPDQMSDISDVTVQHATPASRKSRYSLIEKFELSLKVLRDGDLERSQKVARYMRELAARLRGEAHPDIVKLLCDALADDEWTVRWAVAEALGWLQDTVAIPSLLQVLNDENWIVQVAAIRALVELDAKDYVKELAQLLKHPHEVVRETVIEALGDIGNMEAVPYLRESFVLDNDFIRMASIKSLDLLQNGESVQHLFDGLIDPYVHVRWFAMKHLTGHFTVEHLPLLSELLRDEGKPAWEEERICDLAYDALKQLGTSESVQIINDWLRRESVDEDYR
jgi:HEAT repeat protein